jgi:hypothetical protein
MSRKEILIERILYSPTSDASRAALAEFEQLIREEALTKGRDEGLLAAAMWHQEVSDHDAQGMEYSSLVGIQIANRKELDVSVKTHNWCRDEILSLRDQKEPKG